MGSGRWSSDVYETAERLRGGKSAFAYSDSGARTVHPDLDPFDVGRRESRDSDEHPRSLAIAVLFDVTGSMGGVPRALQKKLPRLLGLLKDSEYVGDPQIMFVAICDETPYPRVKPREVSAWIGDDLPQPVAIRNLVAQLTRRWDTYSTRPEGAADAGDGQVLGTWRGLLGQNVIELSDLDAVCETIALTVGLGEEAIDLDEGLSDLQDVGSTAGSTVGRALAGIGAYHGSHTNPRIHD